MDPIRYEIRETISGVVHRLFGLRSRTTANAQFEKLLAGKHKDRPRGRLELVAVLRVALTETTYNEIPRELV